MRVRRETRGRVRLHIMAGLGIIALPVLSFIFMLAIFIPNLAIGSRRFQDFNYNGWWVVLPVGTTTLLGGIVGSGFILPEFHIGFYVWMGVKGCLWVYLLAIIPGQSGENQYGPDPRAVA